MSTQVHIALMGSDRLANTDIWVSKWRGPKSSRCPLGFTLKSKPTFYWVHTLGYTHTCTGLPNTASQLHRIDSIPALLTVAVQNRHEALGAVLRGYEGILSMGLVAF